MCAGSSTGSVFYNSLISDPSSHSTIPRAGTSQESVPEFCPFLSQESHRDRAWGGESRDLLATHHVSTPVLQAPGPMPQCCPQPRGPLWPACLGSYHLGAQPALLSGGWRAAGPGPCHLPSHCSPGNLLMAQDTSSPPTSPGHFAHKGDSSSFLFLTSLFS